MGAIGMALLARERMPSARGEATRSAAGTSRRSTTPSASSSARLQQRVRRAPVHRRGREDLLGRQVLRPLPQAGQGRQAAGDRRPRRVPRRGAARSYYEARSRGRAGQAAPTVGLPRAMYTYDRLPFWATFFAELGFGRCSRRRATSTIREAGVDTPSPSRASRSGSPTATSSGCSKEGVDYIFVPNLVNEETEFMRYQLARLSVGPDAAVRGAHGAAASSSTPTGSSRRCVQLPRRAARPCCKRPGGRWLKQLGVEPRHGSSAPSTAATIAQDEFRARLRRGRGPRRSRRWRRAASWASSSSAGPTTSTTRASTWTSRASCASTTASTSSPSTSCRSQGIDIRDIVPNMYWNYGRKILQAAQSCGEHRRPAHHLHDQLQVRAGLVHQALRARGVGQAVPHLQFDEHQNDAGAMTRCEAYLDSKGFLRWWSDAALGAEVDAVVGETGGEPSGATDGDDERCASRRRHELGDHAGCASGQAAVATREFGLEGRTLYMPQMPYGGSYLLAAAFRSSASTPGRRQHSDEAHARTRRQGDLRRRVLPAEDHRRRLPGISGPGPPRTSPS